MCVNEGVHTVVVDLCMYDLETQGPEKGIKARAHKTTRFMTSSPETARNLTRRCDRSHWHQPLVNGRASKAALCPEGLCRAICKGLVKQIDLDEKEVKMLMSLMAKDVVHGETPTEEEDHEAATARAWDDV